VHVHAEECAVRLAAEPKGGLGTVVYRGKPYLVVGVYLAHGRLGRRELRYILRGLDEDLGAISGRNLLDEGHTG
jgi:hypothetical protein